MSVTPNIMHNKVKSIKSVSIRSNIFIMFPPKEIGEPMYGSPKFINYLLHNPMNKQVASE